MPRMNQSWYLGLEWPPWGSSWVRVRAMAMLRGTAGYGCN